MPYTTGETNVITAGHTGPSFYTLDNMLLDVYSKEILFQAQPILRFESVAQKRTELLTTPGSTIKFLRYRSLTGDSAIAETVAIAPDSMETELVSISVGEHAKALAVSELLLRQAVDSVLDRAATLLGMHYAKGRDAMLRTSLLSSPNTMYANGKADRSALVAGDDLSVAEIRDAVEALATLKAPKFGGDAYVAFVHPHQARKLRDDAAWTNIQNYASPGNMLTGEIGRIEDVRFIETTMVTYIDDTGAIWADGEQVGTGATPLPTINVYQSIIVGDYALGLAEGLPVEMRDNGVQDFGRRHSLAYYGIWGSGLIEENHCMIIETA